MHFCLLPLFLLQFILVLSRPITDTNTDRELRRCDFPQDFFFGASASAFQFEGAVNEGGRKPSIWDTFASDPAHILDGSSPNTTADEYHHWKDDVTLLKNLGVDYYRFSISWSRLYPDGAVNPEGVAYYNDLINSLLANGIKPLVTLYHWDLPQSLQDSIGGWLSHDIVYEFDAYAEVSFREFGDRVKYWLTFNEPHMFISGGHASGHYAPERCSFRCPHGNSATEPYIAAHNVLLSHAKAVETYRQKYKPTQGGVIGITLDSFWYEPLSSSPLDIAAAKRALDFEFGWFLHPITYGNYPESMQKYVGERLPVFTLEESKSVMNSTDFLGINHYTARYVQDNPAAALNGPSYLTDSRTARIAVQNGIIIGPQAISWLYVVPWAFYKFLYYIKENYNNPPIIVTENGYATTGKSFRDELQDVQRVEYYKSYLARLRLAMRDGVNVLGYFAWSLLDNWEWRNGYTDRFGLHYVDYTTLKRYPKLSAKWFTSFLANKRCQNSVSSS